MMEDFNYFNYGYPTSKSYFDEPEPIDRLTSRQRIRFALTCARRVQHLMRDPRSVAAIDTRERWLRGEATDEEMAAAADAAWAAALAADKDAAWAAAQNAAAAAAWASAWAAHAAAAWAAVWAAAWYAAADWRNDRRAGRGVRARAIAARAADAAQAAEGAAAWYAAEVKARDAERAWQRGELERMLREGGGA
jgi:hypothetical protein